MEVSRSGCTVKKSSFVEIMLLALHAWDRVQSFIVKVNFWEGNQRKAFIGIGLLTVVCHHF
jgi:hypothetical protein